MIDNIGIGSIVVLAPMGADYRDNPDRSVFYCSHCFVIDCLSVGIVIDIETNKNDVIDIHLFMNCKSQYWDRYKTTSYIYIDNVLAQ